MRKTRHRSWYVRDFVHLLVITIAIGAAAYGSLAPSHLTTGAASEAGITGAASVAFLPSQDAPAQTTFGSQTMTESTDAAALVPAPAAASNVEPTFESAFTPEEQATIEARLRALGFPANLPEAAATSTPEPEDANCTKNPSHPLYCIYTVQAGDTLSAIAKAYGLSSSGGITAADMLAQSNKPDVLNSDDIRPGQKLRVPVTNGVIHTAYASESLAEVAEQYGVSVDRIHALSANTVGNTLTRVQDVLIPRPSARPAAAAAATPTPSPTPAATKTPEPTPTPTPEPTQAPVAEPVVEEAVVEEDVVEEEEEEVDEEPVVEPTAPATQANTLAPPPIIASTATATPLPATPTPTKAPATATPNPSAAARTTQSTAPAAKGLFIWPVSGPVSSYFGPSHPLGIDIDLFNNEGVPVGASAAGTVTFAGGNPCCSYGYYVIVDHGNGITTLYAHFSKLAVKEGQKVSQGQVVGYGGSTGNATGTHLHFEMRLNGNVVDPMLYLPK